MNNNLTQSEYRKRRTGTFIIVILLIALWLICRLQTTVLSLTGEPKITLEAGQDYIEEGATAIVDNENVSDSININNSGVNTSIPGIYYVTYNITNNYGDTTIIREVEVVDTKPPEIVLVGNNPLDIIIGDTYTELGAYVLDNVDGNISDKVQISGTVDTSVLGTYVLTYIVNDSSGNTSTLTRTVNVIDAENPIIILMGYSTEYVEAKTIYNEPGFTAIDKLDGDISSNILVTGAVDTNIIDTYVLTYTITNSKGKTNTATRTVVVRDNEKPDLKLNGERVIIINKDNEYIELGAIATDNYDGDITAQINITGTVDTSTIGIYYITYGVTDSSGNQRKIQRMVIVKNTKSISDEGTNNTNDTEDTNTIELPPLAKPVETPVITNIIRSINGAKVTVTGDTSEITEYVVTESSEKPDESEWITVAPALLFSTNITGLSSETNYYLWVRNREGGTESKSFITLGIPIPIYTKEQLSKIGSNETILVLEDAEYQFKADSNYRLENNIDLSGINWTPLPAFTGVFDGNSKTVSNLTINASRAVVGLFSTNSGTIKNLHLENVDIVNTITTGSSDYVGGIVGSLTDSGSIIINCYVTGNIYNARNLSETNTGINATGGIAGYVSRGSIISCYNEAQIVDMEEGSNNVSRNGARYNCVGGIVGEIASGGNVINCFNTGNIFGINDVTLTNGAGITECYVGGIAGYGSSSNIETCYNIGNVGSNKESYSAGLVGWSNMCTVKNCYWYKGASNITKGIGTGMSGTITNEAELKDKDLKRQSSFAGFDFTIIWAIDEGVTTPYLKNLPKPSSVGL